MSLLISPPLRLRVAGVGLALALTAGSVTTQAIAVPAPHALTPPAAASAAQSQATYTLADLTASSADGVVHRDGPAVTVDLSQIPADISSLTISARALPASAGVTTVTFSAGSQAVSHVERLELAPYALAQDVGTPSLESVAFPPGLTQLIIADSALFQYNAQGSTALSQVTFGCGTGEIRLGEFALAQEARTATSLEALTFPEGLHRLHLAPYALVHKAARIAMETVTIPGGLDELVLMDKALSINPTLPRAQAVASRSVILAFNADAAPSQSFIAPDVLAQGSPNVTAASQWVWAGEASTLGQALPGLRTDESQAGQELAATAVAHADSASGAASCQMPTPPPSPSPTPPPASPSQVPASEITLPQPTASPAVTTSPTPAARPQHNRGHLALTGASTAIGAAALLTIMAGSALLYVRTRKEQS